ncbi:hypothetical protein D3C86_2126950 [compost metagenome]
MAFIIGLQATLQGGALVLLDRQPGQGILGALARRLIDLAGLLGQVFAITPVLHQPGAASGCAGDRQQHQGHHPRAQRRR